MLNLKLITNIIRTEIANNDFWENIATIQQFSDPWITPENSKVALIQVLNYIDQSELFLKNFEFKLNEVAVIPYKNVPFSGLVECLFLIYNNQKVFLIKDGKNYLLLLHILNLLIQVNPNLKESIFFVEKFPKHIFTWFVFQDEKRDNSTLMKYLSVKNTLFIKKPVTLVILNGNETESQLTNLGKRVFNFWGFHPGNVRKILIPQGYSFEKIFRNFDQFASVYHHNKYANNYDYHKSIFLMDRKPFLDNGFINVYETTENEVPIGCLGYEFISNPDNCENFSIEYNENVNMINVNELKDWENDFEEYKFNLEQLTKLLI